MKVVVCVKQVASLGDEVEFTEDERDVDPDFLDYALNEWDTYATEEALRLTEASGGEVVVVSVGPEDAEDSMRRCLAMGADRGIRIHSEETLDPIQVARALAEVVQAESPDLVFTGVQSADAVQAATGTALAELLGLPRVAVVTKIELGDGKATVKQAEQKEIDVRQPGDVGEPAYRVRRMFVPPKGEGAEMLNGSPADVAQRIKEIVEEHKT